MADNRNIRGGRDRNLVSARQPHEVRYLCEKFDVDRQIVLDAIETCGNNRSKVEEYLSERTGRGRGNNINNGLNPPV